jgi:hypothetical protein
MVSIAFTPPFVREIHPDHLLHFAHLRRAQLYFTQSQPAAHGIDEDDPTDIGLFEFHRID